MADLESERPAKRQEGLKAGVPRSRLAARVERLLAAALGGDPHVNLNFKASELLADAGSVAPATSAVLERPGPGLAPQLCLSHAVRPAALV